MMEKFHYTLPDGHEIVLPKFEEIKAGAIRKIRRLTQVDQTFTLLEDLLSPEDLEHIDQLNQAELNELAAAWQKASKTKPGESSGS